MRNRPSRVHPRSGLRTVTGMNTPATDRYVELLQAVARSGTRGAPTLILELVTLVRSHELLDGGVSRKGDEMTVAATAGGTLGRTVPLARVATALLGDHEGSVTVALSLPLHVRGQLVEVLRRELCELEVAAAVELEELHLVAGAALAEVAPSPGHRQAVLAYMGIPAQTARARRLRTQLAPAELGWVADTIDALATTAGFELNRPGQQALA